MGETTPTSWKAGACLLIFLVAILLAGMKWGGGDDPVHHVRLACEQQGDTYTCRETRP